MSNGLTIVVADDPSVAKALSRLLRSVELDVTTYPSAEGFLSADPPSRPCCLVLDAWLPGADGLDLQQSMRRRGMDLPIVFISGHADVPTVVRALKAGALDFFEKPFADDDLVDAVHRGIEKDSRALHQRALRETLETRFATLTPREREVMALVARGLSNKRVAYELGTAEKTIKIHRARVMQKMGAGSLPDLVRMADSLPSLGLTSLDPTSSKQDQGPGLLAGRLSSRMEDLGGETLLRRR